MSAPDEQEQREGTPSQSETPASSPPPSDALAQAGADSDALDVPTTPVERPAMPSQPAAANPEKAEVAAKSAADAAASATTATPTPVDTAKSAAESDRSGVGVSGTEPALPPAASGSAGTPTADELTADAKLADPVKTGKLPADPAASIEKTAEAAVPAPEGAQPADAAAKVKPEAAAPKPAAERPARPAKEAEPKEAPRVAPPAGSINEILAAAVPGVEIKAYIVPNTVGTSVAVEVAREDLVAVMTAARDDARLDLKYMRSLSGIDWQEDGLEVVYHLSSFTTPHHLTVKTRISYADPNVPSLTSLYPAADWHERETRDMYGINFEGHPNMVPLLLPEDMTDHFPLRKDNPLQEIEEWQGENLRAGAGEGDE